MTNFLKAAISATFGISAAAKVIDFENTAVYFANFTDAGVRVIRYLLAGAILIELALACLLVFNRRGAKTVYSAILFALIIFLGASVTMALTDTENCGCFGTFLEVSPLISVLKNLLLIVMTCLLKYGARGLERA